MSKVYMMAWCWSLEAAGVKSREIPQEKKAELEKRWRFLMAEWDEETGMNGKKWVHMTSKGLTDSTAGHVGKKYVLVRYEATHMG